MNTTPKQNLPKIDSKNEDERISAILRPDVPFETDEDDYVELPESSLEMLTQYHNFLLNKLSVGTKMKAREDVGYFAWEEHFSWGNGSTKEHEALKKRFASCDDNFEFIQLDTFNEETGLIAQVKRTSDQQTFLIPLVDLEVAKRKSEQHQLVDDYSSWFVNFGPESM